MECNICREKQITTISLQTVGEFGTVCDNCIKLGIKALVVLSKELNLPVKKELIE
tara:strand:- start:559 stop:723 length:165 start_codon:yes stop_codon:yes gene_type:complete